MTQRQLIGLALTGIKAKQCALMKGITENRGKPFVVEGLEKALRETFPIRAELEKMKEDAENV